MKYITLLLLLSSFISHSQISGDLKTDKREIVKDIDYTIYSSKKGIMVFDIIVNRQGKVTSCTLNKEKSNVISTPTMMKCKNRIIQELVFGSSYSSPEWHNGQVRINIQLKPSTN